MRVVKTLSVQLGWSVVETGYAQLWVKKAPADEATTVSLMSPVKQG